MISPSFRSNRSEMSRRFARRLALVSYPLDLPDMGRKPRTLPVTDPLNRGHRPRPHSQPNPKGFLP